MFSFVCAVHVAADEGAADLVELFGKVGADMDAVDGLGQTALHRYALSTFRYHFLRFRARKL